MREGLEVRKLAAVICGRNIWKKERTASGPESAGKAGSRIRAGPDAVEHKRFPLGRLRQRSTVPDHANPAGGAAGAAAADARMRDIIAQARLKHAKPLRHANRPAIAIRQGDHAAPALVQGAHAFCEQDKSDQAEIADQEVILDVVHYSLFGPRADLAGRESLRPPFDAIA